MLFEWRASPRGYLTKSRNTRHFISKIRRRITCDETVNNNLFIGPYFANIVLQNCLHSSLLSLCVYSSVLSVFVQVDIHALSLLCPVGKATGLWKIQDFVSFFLYCITAFGLIECSSLPHYAPSRHVWGFHRFPKYLTVEWCLRKSRASVVSHSPKRLLQDSLKSTSATVEG